SLDAFRLALSIPVDMIEFDIRKSRDNVLYVMHDKETGRTADGSLDIEKAVSDDISGLRLKNGEAIPTLNDVLILVDGKVGLNIEIKSKGAGALTAAHLVGSGYRGPVLISSFKEEEVIGARRVMPDVPVAGIFDTFIPAEVAAYKAKGYHFIRLNRKTVTSELVDLCHKQNIAMYVWTIDDKKEMEKLISWGVDGLYTNKPDLLCSIVGKIS
ncbi:MAG: glycerophosphoryl diester phosphodiesterase, partial [Nitrospirae bacterium]|nr:glycerophosphoryl diester phosphodiesterase [Nitrospirota bacterium]